MEEVLDLELEPMDGDEDPGLAAAIQEAENPIISMVNLHLRPISMIATPWMAMICLNGVMYLYSCVLNKSVASFGLISSIQLIRSCGPHFMEPPTDAKLIEYKRIMNSPLGSRVYMPQGAPPVPEALAEHFKGLSDILTNTPCAHYFLLYEEGHTRYITNSSANCDPKFPVYLLVLCVLKFASNVSPYLNDSQVDGEVRLLTGYQGSETMTKFLGI